MNWIQCETKYSNFNFLIRKLEISHFLVVNEERIIFLHLHDIFHQIKTIKNNIDIF